MSSFLSAGLFVCLVFLLLLLSPLVSLWALNTISEQAHFGWYIPHNFWTYLSVYALAAVFRGGTGTNK